MTALALLVFLLACVVAFLIWEIYLLWKISVATK